MIFVQQIRQTAAHATHAAWLEAHTGYYGKPHGSTVLGRLWNARVTWCGYDSNPLADYRASGYDGRVILPWLGSLLGEPQLYVTADPHAGPMDADLSDTGFRPAEPIPRPYPWVRGHDTGRPAMPDPYLHGPVTEGERIEARYRGESVAA